MYSGMAMLNLNEALFITFTMKKITTILIHSMTETEGTFYKIYLVHISDASATLYIT